MLINAGRLIEQGVSLADACEATLVAPLTDDIDVRKVLKEAVSACLP
jgi:hypothetical protein